MPNLVMMLLEQKHGKRLPCVLCHCWFFPYQLAVVSWHSGPCRRCKIDKSCKCNKEFKPHLVCSECEGTNFDGESCCRYDYEDDEE